MWLSANEIAGLATKAARGAGLPLGHAEDIGRAAVLLARVGELGALNTALTGAHVVQLPEDGTVTDARIAMAGPTAIDLVQAGMGPIELVRPDAPDLLHALVDVVFTGVTVATKADGLILTFDPGRLTEDDVPDAGPIDVAGDVIAALGGFAAKTYVPASEASRIAGAGAGLTDND